ncbi:MAG TPA: DUF2268 domain-containing putative Zn-dependent protease [Allosphingosinicella sp.]|nr:DUF2268 domain-containing putative Zn-dependent protease [Allosphingosinicella sp.]
MRAALILIGGLLLGAAQPLLAEKLPPVRSEQTDSRLKVEILDITPRFLAFYEAARNAPDATARFALWTEHYGFAAVPPGPRGEAMARQLLEQGWPRYAAALPMIRRGAALFGTEPIETLRAVTRLLEADGEVTIRLTAYVGAFDDNAFSAGGAIAFPVEMAPELRRLIMAHEFTHAVHMRLAGLSGGWERSIAETIVQEGLAVHVARELTPGRTMAQYIEHRPGWWDSVSARRAAVLRGLVPVLASKDGETVFRFTVGQGTTGSEREAYAAGWWVVEQLRRQGMSLAQIARIPESEMAGLVERTINRMLEGN